MSKEQAEKKCLSCEYYYITWDKRFPYGCKAFGFKSVSLPEVEVLRASGEECKLFKKRQKTK